MENNPQENKLDTLLEIVNLVNNGVNNASDIKRRGSL